MIGDITIHANGFQVGTIEKIDVEMGYIGKQYNGDVPLYHQYSPDVLRGHCTRIALNNDKMEQAFGIDWQMNTNIYANIYNIEIEQEDGQKLFMGNVRCRPC